LALFLTLPLLRIAEAGARLLFLPSYYDSFWHALSSELWFSGVWWLHTCTWFGWCMSRLLVLWLVAIPVVLLLPSVRRRKTFCVCMGCLCLVVLAICTFKLEPGWNGRSESEWVWFLRSRSPEGRRQAVKELETFQGHGHHFKFGPPFGTISILREGLSDDVLEVRRFAAATLLHYPAAAAVPELTQALKDDDASVRRNSARALAEIGKPANTALSNLQALLQDGDLAVRMSAAEAWLRAGGEVGLALPVLEKTATQDSKDLRLQTGLALARVGKSHPQEVSPLLSTLLHDEEQSVRFYTTLAIYDLGPKAKGLIPALLANLKDKDRHVRGGAAWALGRIGSNEDRVVDGLVELLKNDPEAMVRSDAAYALGYIHALQAKPALEQALQDPDALVRTGAKDALERVTWTERSR
jgi:HEAT repeat protein